MSARPIPPHRLTDLEANAASVVADDDGYPKGKPTAALDDLGNTCDVNDAFI